MPRSILRDLNPTQKEAVTWSPTPLLVLAGAGSGKTRILTYRIAYLISQGVPAFNILGVTFTNKAAQEMKARVQKLVRHDVWVSTFHATCLRILRTGGPRIGIDRNFTVYDDHDQLVLVRECLKALNLNEKQVHPKGVRERIQRAKDILMTPLQCLEKAEDLYEENVGKVYQLYEEKLRGLKACDFGDLIMKAVALFDRHPDVLEGWQDRFQHILIDEYQDTNHAQYRLVKLLAQKRRHITVVGDPDQSIYAWRGADIRNILNFERDYPECGMIRMERNYRSTPMILNAANKLIKHNEMRKPKALWTEREGGEKLTLYAARDEKEEAEFVVHEVMRRYTQGRSLADQVVFYRVHAQSRVIEDALRRANIPYKIVGGIRFYDRKEIKDLISYLRVVAFPHDEVSWRRIINVPSRGIGKKAIEILGKTAASNRWGFDETMKHRDSLSTLHGKARKVVADFYKLICHLRKVRKGMSVSDLLTEILERTGYVRELEAEKTVEAQSRIENIEEFFSVVHDFEESRTRSAEDSLPPLESFLESISLMTDLDTWEYGTNILTLMTFHTAKGLEFPIVYMVGLEEGVFPNINAFSENREELEEERRLCYVGITRAKEKLHMSYARERRLYGAKHYNLPSRFLTEIPSKLFEARSPLLPDDELENDISDDGFECDIDDDEIERRILFD